MNLKQWALKTKLLAGLLALLAATGLPSGAVYFYKANAWAAEVAQSQEQHARQANRAILAGQLAIAKTRVIVYLEMQNQRTLTPTEKLELQIAVHERKVAAEALLKAQELEANK